MTATALRHEALFYDDVEVVAEEIAAIAAAALADDAAVLLCTPPAITETVRTLVGDGDARFVTMDVADRYARPVEAMGLLWRTTTNLLRDGAPRVHSIGEIAFTGGVADAAWMWYEAAVSHVLRDLPLVAVCLYDTTSSPEVLAMAHETHTATPCGSVSPQFPPTHDDGYCAYHAPIVAPPARHPAVRLDALSSAAEARAVLAAAAADAGDVPAEVLDRAHLVVTELTANAILHGGGSASLAVWTDGGFITVRVDDRGPGIADPYATLRPPGHVDHGRGLWLTHHTASALSVGPRPGGGTRAVAVVD